MSFNHNKVNLSIADLEICGFSYDSVIFGDLIFNQPEPWTYVPKILGDVKGVVSKEDRQLLKIVKAWNDEEVDIAIEQYILEYKKYKNKSKVYGKESWKTRGK